MEFSRIIEEAYEAYRQNKKTVLASIIDLEGSSYRREGARMLLQEDGQMTFALSGGCIEMEVFKRSSSVFQDGLSKLIAYDGRERLGCEGVIYILLEEIHIDEQKYREIGKLLKQRNGFQLHSFFKQTDDAVGPFATIVQTDGNHSISLHKKPIDWPSFKGLKQFTQIVEAPFQLLLCGGGHGAKAFAGLAGSLGWEVSIAICHQSPKKESDFAGASNVFRSDDLAEIIPRMDARTAAVVMTHNFDKDLAYMTALLRTGIPYIGMIGSLKRKERLRDLLLDEGFELSQIESIYTPAGLNIGAETPEEIALSIMAEILAVFKKKTPFSLKNMRSEKIHLAY